MAGEADTPAFPPDPARLSTEGEAPPEGHDEPRPPGEGETFARGDRLPEEGETFARGDRLPDDREVASPAPERPPAPDAKANKLRSESEAESLLGPDVRSPIGIPKDYKPLESSLHELFRVELADFAGPLDLLLYLIKKHDVDVLDIPIKLITDKYLEMLDTLQDLPIDIAAEFMVLAAELMHIKSKMLLPAKEGVAVEPDEPEGDPREELVRRLLEYQKYRTAADDLNELDQLGRDIFPRVGSSLDVVTDLDAGLKSVSVFKLVELMAALLKREGTHHEIKLETFSMRERIEYVLAFGEARAGRFTLTELLQGVVSRGELVVTFIAVLEMTRLGLIRLAVEEEILPEPTPPTESLDHVLAEGDEGPRRRPKLEDPPLPTIVITLTGKKMSDQVRDDYR